MNQARRRLPRLTAMQVFECAARHLSFTKAADELCVTQAAVSHQIKALEEWLSIPLFKRLNRAIELTDAGKLYAARTTQAFDLLSEATIELLQAEGTSSLTVSTLDSFASIWLLPRLNRFRQLYPELEVHFESTRDDVNALAQGLADLEIRYGHGDWPGLHVRKILNEEIFPVCSPALLDGEAPLRELTDLRHHKLLHDTISLTWKDWLAQFGVRDVDCERGYSFTHSHLVIQACINGDGVALGRSVLVDDALKAGDLIRPFKESMPSRDNYYIVCRGAEADLHHIKTFALWMISEIEPPGHRRRTLR